MIWVKESKIWQDILSHEVEEITNPWLFIGDYGSNLEIFARTLAHYLLNQEDSFENYLKSNIWHDFIINSNCRQQSDLLILNGMKSSIDDIRRARDFLQKTSIGNNYRILILNNIDYLNINSSNALLKVLEESKKRTLILLSTYNKHNVLDTILSRSFQLIFKPINDSQFYYLLTCLKNSHYIDKTMIDNKPLLQKIFLLSAGDLTLALNLIKMKNIEQHVNNGQSFIDLIYQEEISFFMKRLLIFRMLYLLTIKQKEKDRITSHYLALHSIMDLLNDERKFFLNKDIIYQKLQIIWNNKDSLNFNNLNVDFY